MEEPLPNRLCKTGQRTAYLRGYVLNMTNAVQITSVEQDGNDGLIVTFSDRTTGAYVVEELLLLRPNREPVKVPSRQRVPQGQATQP